MHFLSRIHFMFFAITEVVGMLWIQHPGARTFFRYLGSQSAMFSSIKALSTVKKRELCQTTITAFSVIMDRYKLSPSALKVPGPSGLPLTSKFQMSNLLYAVIRPERFDTIERDYVKNLPDQSKDYTEVRVNVEGEVIAVDALPCISYENQIWYIVGGFVEDLYFTVEKSPEEEDCIVTGLLEPLPLPTTCCCDSIEKLEERYLSSLQKVAHQTGRRTSLCKLDAFHKFRLCIAAFAMWYNRQPGPFFDWYQVRDFDEHHETCMKTVYLSSLAQDRDKIMKMAPVDMVACAIEKDWSAPDFYVIADEFNLRSVFLVDAKLDEGSNEMKYYLHMHLTEVGALTNAMCDNLTV